MRGEIEHLSEDETANLMISAWEMQRVHEKIINFMESLFADTESYRNTALNGANSSHIKTPPNSDGA